MVGWVDRGSRGKSLFESQRVGRHYLLLTTAIVNSIIVIIIILFLIIIIIIIIVTIIIIIKIVGRNYLLHTTAIAIVIFTLANYHHHHCNALSNPVPKLSPSASVTGGQVQIRWAGFAWHWESFSCTKMGRDDKHYKSTSNTVKWR